MKCAKCGSHIVLGHRPGVFFGTALLAALAAALCWTLCRWPVSAVLAAGLLLIALAAAAGVFTQMIDASCWVYSKHKRLGVECDRCKHINPIHPWAT